jgi:hypothetical protein
MLLEELKLLELNNHLCVELKLLKESKHIKDIPKLTLKMIK